MEMCVLPILHKKGVYFSDGTNREILELMDTSHESLPGEKVSFTKLKMTG
jgi:hypothetical protein